MASMILEMIGKSVRIKKRMVPSYSSDIITWESDNEKAVSVRDGVVPALSCGEANITVRTGEVTEIPAGYAVIATGPLTSDALNQPIAALTGKPLYFYDAAALQEWVRKYVAKGNAGRSADIVARGLPAFPGLPPGLH